jgi:hypothetical protein
MTSACLSSANYFKTLKLARLSALSSMTVCIGIAQMVFQNTACHEQGFSALRAEALLT